MQGKAKGKSKSAQGKSKSTAKGRAKSKAKGRAKTKAKGATGAQLTLRTIDAAGKVRVTGVKKALQQSQVYPARFALAVVKHHWPSRFPA